MRAGDVNHADPDALLLGLRPIGFDVRFTEALFSNGRACFELDRIEEMRKSCSPRSGPHGAAPL
jgi:hypothetical protein